MAVPTRFVGLHSHSGASAMDGLGSVQDHIAFCKENGLDAWAATEHGHCNSFAAAYLHVKKMKEKGEAFKFLPGCELYVHPNLDDWRNDYEIYKRLASDEKQRKKELKKERESRKTNIDVKTDQNDEIVEMTNSLTIENEEESKTVSKHFNPINRRHHLVVLPKNDVGLMKLFNLVSRGYIEGFYRFPRVDFNMLKEANKDGDLICSTACIHPDALLTVRIVTTEPSLVRGEVLTRTIAQVVRMLNFGNQLEVLSFNETSEELEFKRIKWGDCTRKNAKLMRLKLKDGRELKLTPDHRVMTQSGWVEAKDLTKEDRVEINNVSTR